jgi:hypothetical protein
MTIKKSINQNIKTMCAKLSNSDLLSSDLFKIHFCGQTVQKNQIYLITLLNKFKYCIVITCKLSKVVNHETVDRYDAVFITKLQLHTRYVDMCSAIKITSTYKLNEKLQSHSCLSNHILWPVSFHDTLN